MNPSGNNLITLRDAAPQRIFPATIQSKWLKKVFYSLGILDINLSRFKFVLESLLQNFQRKAIG